MIAGLDHVFAQTSTAAEGHAVSTCRYEHPDVHIQTNQDSHLHCTNTMTACAAMTPPLSA